MTHVPLTRVTSIWGFSLNTHTFGTRHPSQGEILHLQRMFNEEE